MGAPPTTPGFQLSYGVGTDEIGSGDHVIQRGAPGEPEALVPFVFATVPALQSYGDTAGNSAKVSCPAPTPPDWCYPATPGDSVTSGLPAGAPDDQDVVLRLTFWRPQRRPIPGEKCPEPNGPPCKPSDWIDIGGLTYSAIVQHVGQPPGGIEVAKLCPPSSLSSSDLEVTAASGPGGGALMLDHAGDLGPANPSNTFTYTLNLSACLRQLGVSSWNTGDLLGLTTTGLTATGSGDAEETVNFKRK
jgi:hypothetical protein